MKTRKSGFTLVEMLVAMAILVIAFGLVTYLYTRAAKIRKIVVVNNEIQQVLSQMVNTLTYGDKTHAGIIDAAGLDDSIAPETMIKLKDKNGNLYMTATITDGTLSIQWGSDTIYLDPNNKIQILREPGFESRFEYIGPDGNVKNINDPSERNEVTFVKIVLWARSNDPVMKSSPSVPLVTGIRLRGKPSF